MVHRHMEAEVEAMAAVTEVAAMEIHLDLEDSLPGGRCHHLTPWRLFSKQSGGRQFLHDPVLAPGRSARPHHDNFYISCNSIKIPDSSRSLFSAGFFPTHSSTCWARRSKAMPTSTIERRCGCPSARIIDSVGLYPFRLIALDTLRRPGA